MLVVRHRNVEELREAKEQAVVVRAKILTRPLTKKRASNVSNTGSSMEESGLSNRLRMVPSSAVLRLQADTNSAFLDTYDCSHPFQTSIRVCGGGNVSGQPDADYTQTYLGASLAFHPQAVKVFHRVRHRPPTSAALGQIGRCAFRQQRR